LKASTAAAYSSTSLVRETSMRDGVTLGPMRASRHESRRAPAGTGLARRARKVLDSCTNGVGRPGYCPFAGVVPPIRQTAT